MMPTPQQARVARIRALMSPRRVRRRVQVVLVVFGVISVVVGAGLVAGAWRKLQHRAAIARIPTSATGSVGPGPAEVRGKATPLPGAPLVPGRFTDGKGVLGVWRVQELRQRGKSSKWVTVHEEREAPVFAVDDGTGPVLVDVAEADVDAPPTHVEESRMGKDPSPRVLAYLERHGLRFEGMFGVNRRMRYHETLVPVGQPLYVLGVAEMNPAGGRARYLIRSGEGRVPFLVSTRDEKGVSRRALLSALGLVLAALLLLGVGAAMAYSGWTSP